jgi:hypothetical protein
MPGLFLTLNLEPTVKLTYTSPSGRISLEADVDGDEKAVIEKLARLQDVFDEQECGVCHSPNIRFDVRTPQGYTYREWKCRACTARLDISEHKPVNGGGLYIDRKDDQGNPLPNAGWYKYQPETGNSPPPPPPPATIPLPPPPRPPLAAKSDPYLDLIAAAKNKGSLAEVGNQIAADRSIDTGRRTILRAAYESRQVMLNGKASGK